MQRYVYPVDLSEVSESLEKICLKTGLSKAEAIREAVRQYADNVRGIKVIETRQISRKQAEKEIMDFLKKEGKAFTSEIADELRLDVLLVDEVLHELAEKNVVK